MKLKWPAELRVLLSVVGIVVLLSVGKASIATEADSSSDGTMDVQAPADGGGAKTEETEKPRRPWQRRPQWQGPRVPEGVKALRDLEYAKVGERPLLLDLYVPEKADGPLPLVVWVHGGGWQSGNKRNCKAIGFSGKGYVVASIGYRLSGEAPFPAQIHDCKAAVRWLRSQAGKYNIDPKRVGAWGSSAGGHLVALMGTSGDVKELEGDLGPADQSSRVQAVCNFYGPGNLVTVLKQRGVNRQKPSGAFYKLFGGPIDEKQALIRAASPVTHISKDDPPFLLVHGENDRVVPYVQSVEFDKALKAGGVESTFYTVKGAGHGFRNAGAAERTAIDRAVREFFDKHLKPAKATDKQEDQEQKTQQKDQKKQPAAPAS